MASMITANEERTQMARKPVGLALQGGGSWGAYTWGVLDTLLGSRSVAITQLSGTSAGAINAAIVASGLATGSAGQARKALESFWMAVACPAMTEFVASWWGPMERAWRQSVGAWILSGATVSPYAANPLGANPLRDIIEKHVDIEAIRSRSAPELFVTLTSVRTGLPRVISNENMSIDALLASACLPQLFQAVEIDGEPYWDGGYCGNPTLWPLIHGHAARDLIIVQLVPDEAVDVPKDAASIRRRIGEIVFNSSLVAEMQAIAAMRSMAARDGAPSMADIRFHRIGPPPPQLLSEGSSLERSRVWLEQLRDEGRGAAKRFITRHGADIGVRETLDIAAVFADGHKPKMRAPANEESFDDDATVMPKVAAY